MNRVPALDSSPRRLPKTPLALGGLCLVAVLACGGPDRPLPLGSPRPIPGCDSFSYRACDILTPVCQKALFELVACVYGDTDAGDPPPVRRYDEASAAGLIEEDSSPTMPDGLDATVAMTPADSMSDEHAFRTEVRGLELLGQLAPGLIEDEQDVVDESVSRVIAYYRVSTREIVIIDRGDPVDDLEANVVLAHEFVHALQDARYGLATFGFERALDSDAILARASLIEGEASLYQYLIGFAYRGAELDRIDYQGFFDRLARAGLDAAAQAGSPALTASSIFPYTFGTIYAGQSWLAGGSSALDALYQAPPQTTWEVLRSGSDAARDPGTFETAPQPLEGYSLASDDVAGAWVSVAVLAALPAGNGTADALLDLAGQWQRDRYWIYATGDEPESVAALWAIDWASATAATQFSTLAAGLAPEGAVLRIDTLGQRTRLVAVERAGDLDAWRARWAELDPQ